MKVRVTRADIPQQDRETARAHTLALLETMAVQHGVDAETLRRARRDIKRLPGFPRDERDDASVGQRERAVLMHIPEGRERLVREKLRLDDQNGVSRP